MATAVIMPRQGQSVESCIISKWNKNKGDRVNMGDVLFSYETDKASFEEEARVDGIVLDIFFEEGDDVPCLTNVCVIGSEGEDASEFDPRIHKGQKADEGAAAGQNSPVNSDAGDIGDNTNKGKGVEDNYNDSTGNINADLADAEPGARLKISPRARISAGKAGIDYRQARPTGPGGRIIERDIDALRNEGPFVTSAAREEYINSSTGGISGTGIGGRIRTNDLNKPLAGGNEPAGYMQPRDGYREIRLTNIRKVIAGAMHHSLSSTAQLTLNTSFDASGILAFRRDIKAHGKDMGLENITLTDMIFYAVSRTLPLHESLNAHFLEDRMLVFNNVHLGMAVDTERGLMVPTLRDANLKSLNEISGELKKLAEDCRKGSINPDLLKGASFTITNLGSLGIESFTPVLNPPQTGILGVNSIIYRTRMADGELTGYPAMGLSLTFDHRALDGAPAARFLQELKKNLEDFNALLAK